MCTTDHWNRSHQLRKFAQHDKILLELGFPGELTRHHPFKLHDDANKTPRSRGTVEQGLNWRAPGPGQAIPYLTKLTGLQGTEEEANQLKMLGQQK